MKILLATLEFSNGDLLEKCVSSWPESVDTCVLWQGMNDLERTISENAKHIDHLIRRKNNWGVSGGWNIVLRDAFHNNDYDGVVFVGSDTRFMRDFWDEFVAGFGNNNFVESTHQFNCFYIDRFCFNVVGSFDENFFPAYVEDDDYRTRVKKSIVNYKKDIGSHDKFYHYTSATVRRNPMYHLKSRVSYGLNKEYMHEKWGGFEHTRPKWIPIYNLPFNNDQWPLNKWILDPYLRKRQLWHNIIDDDQDDRLMALVNAVNNPDKYKYDYLT